MSFFSAGRRSIARRASAPRGAVRAWLARVALVAGALLAGLLLWAPAALALSPAEGEGAGFCASVTSAGYDLGANFDNVWACGPLPGGGAPGYGDAFESSPYGFQCTELADRFLWDVWGISPVFGSDLDGENFAATVHADDPSVPLVANGTAGQPYLPGDIVSFTGNSDEPDGHVAVVIASTEDSSGNGQVTIMEENAAASGQETLAVSNWSLQKASGSYVTPYEFDALQTTGSSSFGNGSFVQVSGSSAIYEIAGGAPLYVSSWSAVGGSQPYTVISQQQFNALNVVPSNGTLIRDAASGAIWIVAGGAPLYVSSCSAIDTCIGVIDIDPWDVQNVGNPAAHLNAVPANGTLIRDKTSGAIWIVAGGAPLYVSSCSAIDTCSGVVDVDPYAVTNLDHLNAVPANGTLIRDAASGAIWIVAGGAPLYVSSCSAIDTCSGVVDVDPYAVTNLDHLNAVPANGTLIRDKTSGGIWIVAGGAPLYVSSCSAIDTCTGVVDVDPYAVSHLDHLNPVPANGTYIRDKTSGQIWRIAGGAPFAISTCQYLNGCPGPVDVDPYAVAHLDHLSATPANGTIVEGVPSDIYWSFSGGLRSTASANTGATAVDDAGLDAFPEQTVPAPEPPAGPSGTAPGAASSSSPAVTSSGAATTAPSGGSAVAARCVVPRLEHLTLAQARRALSRGRCELGTAHRPRHVRSGAVLRVVSQSLRPGTKHQANYRVSVTLR